MSWRKRKIAQIIDEAEEGDTLVVSELSRLGRSMLEIMEILSVATHKGVGIYAVKGDWQLDGSLQSKVVAMAFAIAAEIERDLISQHTKEALAARKKAGMKLEGNVYMQMRDVLGTFFTDDQLLYPSGRLIVSFF